MGAHTSSPPGAVRDGGVEGGGGGGGGGMVGEGGMEEERDGEGEELVSQ